MFYRFTLPADYSKQIFTDKIKAVSYTEFENEPSLVHSHKNVTEVIFVKSGEGSIAYRDTETEIKPNTIYFVNPNTDHTEISKSNLSYFVVHLSDFVVSDKDKIPIKSLEIGQKEYREIIGLLSLAMDEIKSPKNTAFCLSLFSAVYFRVMRVVSENPLVEISKNNFPDHSSTVQSCINYVNVYFSSANVLDELCRKFNLSRRNLERIFKRELNVSPLSFVKRTRMEQAETLLLNSSYSVSQIASMCGFASFAYFSKEFKKSRGLSPSAFRENNPR